MKNYVQFQYEVMRYVANITDCNRTFVYHLMLAASSTDIIGMRIELCKMIDQMTGCGYRFALDNASILFDEFSN